MLKKDSENMEKDVSYIVAIDVGTSNVITLIGKKADDGKLEIVAKSIVETEPEWMIHGIVRNIDKIVGLVEKSVSSIEREYGIKVCEAFIGLTGQHIKCMQHEGYVNIVNRDGEVKEEDVMRLSTDMRNISVPAGEVIVHILPQNYILDEEPIASNPVGMVGRRLSGKFNVITGDKSKIDLVNRSLSRAEVGVKDIILNSLASAEAVLVDDQKELGVAVVDIGGGTCDICIFHDKAIRYLGVIPLGGNDINADIKSCGVLGRLAEKLKVKFGSALSDLVPENEAIRLPSVNNTPSNEISKKQLSSIIEARMLDTVDALKAILVQTGYINKLSSGIVLTGGCAQLKDIAELFKRHLNIDVRVAVPDLYVTSDSVDKVNDPAYSTAVGLLLIAMTLGRPTRTISIARPKPVDAPVYDNRFAENQQSGVQGNLFDDDSTVESGYDMLGSDPAPNDDRTPKKGGFGKWLNRTVGKVREMVEPQDDDDLEDNTI